MLSAYLGWAGLASQEELMEVVPWLWTVEHRPVLAPPVVIADITVPSRLCTAVGCPRCGMGRGGYRFCWADRRWIDMYEDMRRPGSHSFMASSEQR